MLLLRLKNLAMEQLHPLAVNQLPRSELRLPEPWGIKEAFSREGCGSWPLAFVGYCERLLKTATQNPEQASVYQLYN
jgi:hypothetical protein